MSTVPIPAPDHPAWCDRQHPDTFVVHSREIGELSLTDTLDIELQLVQVADAAAEVQIFTHRPDETAVTGLTLDQAGILRDLLTDALALAGAR
jgi:hypothetical protein